MAQNPHPAASLFTQVDISASPTANNASSGGYDEHTQVLRQLLEAQDRQNELMEELISQVGAAQRQRTTELAQWKQANPDLARACRMAAEALSRVQMQFLESLTDEVRSNADDLVDGEFVFNEFVDRFGPRLAHLNGVLQVLSQLSSTPNAASNNPST